MHCRAMRTVRRLISIASTTRDRSSLRITTSAASAVIPPPCPASAMPTVAALSAGASFVPSPTMSTRSPSSTSAATTSTLSDGRSPPRDSVTPICIATAAVCATESPERSRVRRTPELAQRRRTTREGRAEARRRTRSRRRTVRSTRDVRAQPSRSGRVGEWRAGVATDTLDDVAARTDAHAPVVDHCP